MSAFESLGIALRGHFHKSLAQLPPDIQQRVLADFAPWPWDSKTSRERCQRAKQWDFENNPATREIREGIAALTNPDSPGYSPEERQRLRGDFLPEPRNVQPIIVLPPLEWDAPQLPSRQRATSMAKESAEARAVRLLNAYEEEVNASGEYGSRLASMPPTSTFLPVGAPSVRREGTPPDGGGCKTANLWCKSMYLRRYSAGIAH